jgi:hypothetical protein
MKTNVAVKLAKLILTNPVTKGEFQRFLNQSIDLLNKTMQFLTKVYGTVYCVPITKAKPTECTEEQKLEPKPKYARKETMLERVYNYLADHPQSSAKEITQGICGASDRASIRRISFSLARLKRSGQIKKFGNKRWQVTNHDEVVAGPQNHTLEQHQTEPPTTTH